MSSPAKLRRSLFRCRTARRGSSVFSATVALCVLAVTASYSIPQWARRSEAQTAAEAIEYLQNVRQAQRRYHAQHGRYADDLAELDLAYLPPAYFSVGQMEPLANRTLEETWSLTLRRYDIRSLFGCYSITCTQAGFPATVDQTR